MKSALVCLMLIKLNFLTLHIQCQSDRFIVVYWMVFCGCFFWVIIWFHNWNNNMFFSIDMWKLLLCLLLLDTQTFMTTFNDNRTVDTGNKSCFRMYIKTCNLMMSSNSVHTRLCYCISATIVWVFPPHP